MGLLAGDRQSNVFKLDYSKRTAQLYQEAFTYMVREVESLNFIGRCMLSLKNPSGPTWVPNLNAAHPIGDFALSHASGDAAPEMRLIQGHKLQVIGRKVATVAWPLVHAIPDRFLPHEDANWEAIMAIQKFGSTK